MIIAVDFDGTLCTNSWPEIGKPKRFLKRCIRWKKQGHKLILWTCREGEALQRAVEWCSAHGLYFDAVNANLPEMNVRYGNDSRKIGADRYYDDKGRRVR